MEERESKGGHPSYLTMFLDVDTFLEAGRTVVPCEALRISDHGDTEDQAFKNLA